MNPNPGSWELTASRTPLGRKQPLQEGAGPVKAGEGAVVPLWVYVAPPDLAKVAQIKS